MAKASDAITVAVATNFKPALTQLTTNYTKQTGVVIRVSSASTGVLYNQIRKGAPFDLFLSADAERPKLLEQQQRIVAGSRQTYAVGQLVLVSNDKSLSASGEILRDWQGRLAIANPRIAPYGLAAQQALTHIQRWPWSAKGNNVLVRGNSVAQTFQFIHSGNVKLALVAHAQVQNSDFAGGFWLVPNDWYQPIEQQLVVLKSSKNHKLTIEFVDWLMAKPQQQQIVALGYGLNE